MRNVAWILALLVAPAFTVLAQGRVNFNNVNGQLYPIYTGFAPSNNVGANYSIQLRWVVGTITDQSAFEAANPAASVAVAFFGVTGGSPETDGAGLFDGGTVAIGPVGTYTMQARAWYNGGFYPTYDHAATAGVLTGRSVLFTMNVTAPPTAANHTVFPSLGINTFGGASPPPKLAITLLSNQVVVSWPYNPAFSLQTATNLTTSNWVNIPGPFPIVSGRYALTNSVSGSSYFRLRR